MSKTVASCKQSGSLSANVAYVRQPDLYISLSSVVSHKQTQHQQRWRKESWVRLWSKMCFNTSLLLLLLYNWFLFTCFVTSTKLDLRFSLALCDKEKQFRQTRRERVMLGIKKLLDMEKPRFLPSSPEEVGTSRLTIPLANLKPTHSLASSSSSHLSHAAICCSWFHWRTGWRATAAPKGSLSVCILQGELASLPASCDATLT